MNNYYFFLGFFWARWILQIIPCKLAELIYNRYSMRVKKRTSRRVSFCSCRSLLSTRKSRVILWLLQWLLFFLSSRYLRPLLCSSSLLWRFYPWWFLRNRFTKSWRLLLVIIHWLFLEYFVRYPIIRFIWFALVDTLILGCRGNILIFHFLYSLFWCCFASKKDKILQKKINFCNLIWN